MALPESFLEELRARTPLAPLIGARTKLTRVGRQWKGCCPFHGEKTPSFYVYDDHYHCFGCGAHGDAFAFVMQTQGAGFMEAVERLAAEAGLEVPKPSPQARAREERAKGVSDALEAASRAYQRRLRSAEGREALDYLQRRGLSDDTIARFGLGWSGGGRGALAAELRGEGIEPRLLVEAGLMAERDGGTVVDLFFNRVMFPIRDRRGRLISFGGRILGDGQPKYVNGPETAVFSKRRTLYGLDLAREAVFRGATLVVAEGYMDVIALHQAGFGGAVAPLGTALTAEQLEALWAVGAEPILCLDGDAAGARAAAKAVEVALPLLTPGRSLRLATLPSGEDPDSLCRTAPHAMRAALEGARPLHQALYGLLAGGSKPPEAPEARAALRHRLEEAARTIPDRALAAEYRRALLDRYFEAVRPRRPGSAAPGAKLPRPADPDAQLVRRERARTLLAVAAHHPHLLPDLEEPLALLDLPEGEPARARAALLSWLATAPRLDSEGCIAHLRAADLGVAQWLLREAGLPEEARPTAQPADALAAFWQLYGFLRGPEELEADRREAQAELVATNSPAAERRLVRLSEALGALRRGEPGETGDSP